MARSRAKTRYVRQMPRIYGNLQPERKDYGSYVRAFSMFLWGLAGLGIVYGLLFSGFFNVKKVEIEGVSLGDAAAIRSTVPLGGSMWFLSKDQIAAFVAEDPAVSEVAVVRALPDTVRVIVKERKASLVWRSGEKAYVLDTQGLPFLEYPTMPSVDTPEGVALAAVPSVKDLKSLPVTLGKQPAGGTFVTFVNDVRSQMNTLLPDLKVDRFEVSDSTYDVTMITAQGLQAQFNSLGDAGVQSRNLARLIEQNKANVTTSTVDLRIDRWGYVR